MDTNTQQVNVADNPEAPQEEAVETQTPEVNLGEGAPADPNPPAEEKDPEVDWAMFKSVIPEEHHQYINNFSNVQDLVKSYVHAQDNVLKGKIPVPDKYATDQDWLNTYRKLGLPEELDSYEVKPPEGQEVDETFLKGFKEAAFGANILPHQAQKMFDWYEQEAQRLNSEIRTEQQNAAQQGIQQLSGEWGTAFESKVNQAKAAVAHFGGDEFKQYLNESGLGNDPMVIKFAAKVGELLNEDQVRGLALGVTAGRTVDEAREEISRINGDLSHAYWDKQHANHRKAVDDMKVLYQQAYPGMKGA